MRIKFEYVNLFKYYGLVRWFDIYISDPKKIFQIVCIIIYNQQFRWEIFRTWQEYIKYGILLVGWKNK